MIPPRGWAVTLAPASKLGPYENRRLAGPLAEWVWKNDVFYLGQPGGKPKTEFTPTASEGKSATFENPEYDHPKLIRYYLGPDGGRLVELAAPKGSSTSLSRG